MDTARFPAEIQELHRILKWVRTRLAAGGVSRALADKLELASEEAIVNVILHGYPKKKGEVEIAIKWSGTQVSITIRDSGPPFNPLKKIPKGVPLAPIEEREPGGLGIYLIQQIADELHYSREGGENVLIISKRFSRKK
jgi:anti-sigma regulatory factor (Ser/Thr protein kinase)